MSVGTWAQVFPYADRLNYVSPMLNNVGFSLAVEKLLDIEVPERCQYYRVVLGELARICDHFTCNGASAMELGAFTPFLWMLKVRDWIWDILEKETGARMTHSFGRIGGMAAPPTDGLQGRRPGDPPGGLQRRGRGRDHAPPQPHLPRPHPGRRQPPEGARHRPRAAPARSAALRRASTTTSARTSPYLVYDRFDFDVPVGNDGDNWDRFMVRMEEIRQSCRIIEQALEQMPTSGPVSVEDPRIVLPEKREVYTPSRHHRPLQAGDGGPQVPPKGEVYSFTEAGNGELGFSPRLRRQRHALPRPGAPALLVQPAGRFREMLIGDMIADIIPTFGSINMIGGECDRSATGNDMNPTVQARRSGEIPFEPGDTIIAPPGAGIEIPHYCWHPGLSASPPTAACASCTSRAVARWRCPS